MKWLMKLEPMNPAPPVTRSELGVNVCGMQPPISLTFAVSSGSIDDKNSIRHGEHSSIADSTEKEPP
jgi:hypothetical protein